MGEPNARSKYPSWPTSSFSGVIAIGKPMRLACKSYGLSTDQQPNNRHKSYNRHLIVVIQTRRMTWENSKVSAH